MSVSEPEIIPRKGIIPNLTSRMDNITRAKWRDKIHKSEERIHNSIYWSCIHSRY